MSLFAPCFSFLAIKPNVWVEGDILHARACRLVRAAALGGYDRWVTVDRAHRTITICSKSWWRSQREEIIPFERVAEIDHSFSRWSRHGHHVQSYRDSWNGTDQLEFIKVSLCLRDPLENVPLFLFWGEGAVETGATGVLLFNDDVVDFSGDQRARAEVYAQLLHAFTGAHLHKFRAQGLLETLDRWAH